MYVKGVTDYDKNGQQRETGMFAGLVSSDGELRTTKNGKEYGQASVRAFNRKDGTAAFMAIRSFNEYDGRIIANLRKGDRVIAAGLVETREYNGKTYTDMMVDFIISSGAPITSNMDDVKAFLAENQKPQFEVLSGEDGELPF